MPSVKTHSTKALVLFGIQTNLRRIATSVVLRLLVRIQKMKEAQSMPAKSKVTLAVKTEAKRRVKRKKKTELNARIWLLGSRKWKDKRSVTKVLCSFDHQKVDFVMLGTAPGLEQLALPICRRLKFNVVIMPPNITRDGYNATYFRNYLAFTLLKPTHVFGFHDHIEQSSSTIQAIKLARAKKVEHQVITTKKVK